MTYKEVADLIKAFGLKYAYYSFPEKAAPPLPYVLFYFPNSDNFSADNQVYKKVAALNIEFYSRNKDFLNEENIEAVLNDRGIVWEKSESYLDSENMFEVLYQTEVVING